MREIELTQGKVALVDDQDYEYLMQWKWYAANHRGTYYGVRHSSSAKGRKRKAIFIHQVIAKRMGIVSEMVDHKDQNSLNNQRLNIRGATRSQNKHNSAVQSNSTTGVKGVYLRSNGKYRARIIVEGTAYYLGHFDNVSEAASAVQQKREELVGEFACH